MADSKIALRGRGQSGESGPPSNGHRGRGRSCRGQH